MVRFFINRPIFSGVISIVIIIAGPQLIGIAQDLAHPKLGGDAREERDRHRTFDHGRQARLLFKCRE